MSTDTIRTDEKQPEVKCASVVTNPTEMLASIVDGVQRDSRQAAKAYLAESEVKHGGE